MQNAQTRGTQEINRSWTAPYENELFPIACRFCNVRCELMSVKRVDFEPFSRSRQDFAFRETLLENHLARSEIFVIHHVLDRALVATRARINQCCTLIIVVTERSTAVKVSGDRTRFLYALKKRIAIRPRERFYAHASRVHPPSYYAEAWNLKLHLIVLIIIIQNSLD